ncbi:MAG: hypothetical protein NC307_14830 [Roseburia sp.]|nr:hypothetical protein [Roseburia sp.]
MENKNVEEWIKIKKYGVPDGEFMITSFVQDIEGVKIVLEDDKCIVKILFDGIPVLLRNTVEGLRMRTWGEVQSKYQDKNFFRYNFLYKVENSDLINWCVEESCGFYENNQLMHFCIVTSEEMIDIISTFEPVIEVV